MTFGIPMAKEIKVDGVWGQECPVCQEFIPSIDMKDWESFSGREYAEHYAKEHDNGN